MKQLILTALIISFQLSVFAQKETTAFHSDTTSEVMEQTSVDLRIFPNPVINQKVSLEMNSDAIAEIRLVNIVGKEVMKKNFKLGVNQYQMKLEDVPKGIYLIQVKTTDNKAIVKKLLISGN